MIKKVKWEWESLDENTSRVKVMGGWLVLHNNKPAGSTGKGKESFVSESMIFVADRDHEWMIAPAFDPADKGKQRANVNASDFERPQVQ